MGKGKGKRTSRPPPNEGLASSTTRRAEWGSPVLQPPADQDGEQRQSPPSFGALAIKQPGASKASLPRPRATRPPNPSKFWRHGKYRATIPKKLLLKPESIFTTPKAKYRSIWRRTSKNFQSSYPSYRHWGGKILFPDEGPAPKTRPSRTEKGGKLLGVPKRAPGKWGPPLQLCSRLRRGGSRNESWRCASTQPVPKTGATMGLTILQQKNRPPLFLLACRHHVHELFLEKGPFYVFGVIFWSGSPSSSLQGSWSYINQSAIKTLHQRRFRGSGLPKRDDLIQGFLKKLFNKAPRDDYKEMLS
ncbi:hypothetical protein GWK47_032953 [Chionoecetes opilio]|uniref:Uncharacterized protein n=1 Tax=Chionoecetes opilio TaxID=41210 RepID=A0A8J4YHC6_CHIOP|nr:hypothetical protein GWK47_032953 [Chionoecetes opilio]